MKIDNLIDKYFEGNTTCEEEKQIRLFFKQDQLPAHLEEYRGLFSFFDEEAKAFDEGAKIVDEKAIITLSKKQNQSKRFIRYAIVGIAASTLLIIGSIGLYQNLALPHNYVMIDGVCYTEKNLVIQEALNSLNAVSISEDDILNTLLHN